MASELQMIGELRGIGARQTPIVSKVRYVVRYAFATELPLGHCRLQFL